MRTLGNANLALRFALELAALVSLAVGGYALDAARPLRVLAAIALPVVAATTWGMFVSPKARVALSPPGRLAVEALVFLAAATALFAAGHPRLAGGLLVTATISRLLKSILPASPGRPTP